MAAVATNTVRAALWLVALALLAVALAHWRSGQWLDQQRLQLQQRWYFSYAGYAVNPFAGTLALRDLRISSAPTADYLSIPTLTITGLSPLQLLLGLRPSAALSFAAPRVELYRRGALFEQWAARAPAACQSSGSWADLSVDSRGYAVAALHGELLENAIFGEFSLLATLRLEPVGALLLNARLQTQRADMTELSLAMWPQLEALQLTLQPDTDALQKHYQQCAEQAQQTLAQWRAEQHYWQLGPLRLRSQPPRLADWLAAPQPLRLSVRRSEYSVAEWLGLAGGHRLDAGSDLQLELAGERLAVAELAVLAPPQTAVAESPQPLPVPSGEQFQRQPWQQLSAQLGRPAQVYVAQRRQPHQGELVAVDERGLVLLQRHREGEVRLPLRRATIVRVQTGGVSVAQ